MSDVLNDFFSQQSEDDQRNLQLSFDNNSDTESGQKIDVAGSFRMRVISKAFKNKDNETVMYPDLKISSQAKALMLYVVCEVVDDTAAPIVNKGDYAGFNIVLSPAPGSSREKFDNTMRMSKPRIAALLGRDSVKGITFDKAFIGENLLTQFKEVEDGVFEEVSRHKMDQEVYVTFEEGFYNNKPSLDFKKLCVATDKMHSVVYQEPATEGKVENDIPSFGEDSADTAAAGLSNSTSDDSYDDAPF
jgi:hypothetical protein